jgi:hypothetical protein
MQFVSRDGTCHTQPVECASHQTGQVRQFEKTHGVGPGRTTDAERANPILRNDAWKPGRLASMWAHVTQSEERAAAELVNEVVVTERVVDALCCRGSRNTKASGELANGQTDGGRSPK